jgi:predicted nucleic acid-binding protein
MTIKVFLDTNILLDFFDISRKEHAAAINIFQAIENGEINGFISESVINTTSYFARKWMDNDTFKQVIIDLLKFFTVLPCSNSIVKQAYRNAKNDLEDAVLYELALENGLGYFITSNLKDLKKIEQVSLKVMTTQSFLTILNN